MRAKIEIKLDYRKNKGTFQVALVVKNTPAKAGYIGNAASIPGWGISPEEENGNPLQYSCWRIPWMEEPGRL